MEKRQTFKQILEEVWAMKPQAEPTISRQELKYEGIRWAKGSRFNYRIFAALLLLNRNAAKEYFRTTT